MRLSFSRNLHVIQITNLYTGCGARIRTKFNLKFSLCYIPPETPHDADIDHICE